MEKYNQSKLGKYRINTISRSKNELSILSESLPDEMKLSFLPYLIVNSKKKTLTALLTGQFLDEKEKPITNQLVFQIEYQIDGDMPIFLNEKKMLQVDNSEIITALFDTTIGAFRGVLFEWLKGSRFQRPLPLVDLGEFLSHLQVSFTK